MKDILICPKCKEILSKYNYEVSTSYKCKNNHTYDVSKRGYINLLLPNQMNSKDPGDNKEMVLARKSFLEKEYYSTLKKSLCENIINNKIVLDLGCGEGYYTEGLTSKNTFVLGSDISKSMINEASKKIKDHNNLLYIIASNNNLPILDNSIDACLSCFSPLDLKEVKRILNNEGKLYKVTPGKYHLYELKEVLYDNPYLNQVNLDLADSNFEVCENIKVKYNVKLETKEDIMNLFIMTPYYYKTKKEGVEKIRKLDSLEVTLDFDITVYKVRK